VRSHYDTIHLHKKHTIDLFATRSPSLCMFIGVNADGVVAATSTTNLVNSEVATIFTVYVEMTTTIYIDTNVCRAMQDKQY
ncbi:hypothetical protein BHM03_00044580, partial [Ensete ventricosum]